MAGLQQIEGKVAVVTGGASGIGRGIAEQLIAQGARVVIADIEADALERTAREIGAVGVVTNVADHSSVQNLAAITLAQFGGVDIVCNNAGVGPMAKLQDLALSDWRWMIDVNLWGVIHGVHVFLPLLRKNPSGGHIVNTASVGGFATMPGLGAYSVTKFGVVALSECLADELAQEHSKVGVTVLAPGPVRSNLGKSQRNRPAGLGPGALVDVELDDVADQFAGGIPWVQPSAVGQIVVEAIRTGKLYAITHPDMFAPIEARHSAIAAAFAR